MIVVSHNNSATTTTRLLLVDNEYDNISVLSMGLEDEGFEVDAFTDPLLALSNFKSNYYSLVILDINMPKMTAYELHNESLRNPTKEILNEVKCFIPKPLTIEDLIRNVKKELT